MHAGIVFVADDLGAWLIGLLADAGRKKLTSLVLGTDQQRALRSVATAAVVLTARELRPDGDERAEHLALVVSEVFGVPVPEVPPGVMRRCWRRCGRGSRASWFRWATLARPARDNPRRTCLKSRWRSCSPITHDYRP